MSNPYSLPRSTKRRNRAGAAMILMLILLIAIIGVVAFSVDIGMMVLLRAEIQNAVDSGALAACLELQDNPKDIKQAEATAKEFIQLNSVGITKLVAADAIEVEPGTFDCDADAFTATSESPNAIRVFARQDEQPFFFARIFGMTTFGAPAPAIASAASDLDIMMVLDLSGSMADEGRIKALRNAAPTFVEVIEEFSGDDQIGVMGLSANPDKYDPQQEHDTGMLYASGLHPTADYNVGVLEAVLDDDFSYLKSHVLTAATLQAGKYTNYTGTGAAIGDAVHYLINGAEARDDVEKIIVLMSDGHANRPSSDGPGYARKMAAYAAAEEVTIYTISLGNDADLDLMQEIANITDGEHFDATGSGEKTLTDRLKKAFEDVATTIKRAQLVH